MDTAEKLDELLAITYELANIVAGRVSGVDTEAFISSAQLVEAARMLQQRIKWVQES